MQTWLKAIHVIIIIILQIHKKSPHEQFSSKSNLLANPVRRVKDRQHQGLKYTIERSFSPLLVKPGTY